MNNFFMEAGNPWCQNSLGELFEALCVSLPAYLEWVSKRDFDCHQMCSCVLHTGLWPGKAFPVLRQLRSIVEVCCGFLGCFHVVPKCSHFTISTWIWTHSTSMHLWGWAHPRTGKLGATWKRHLLHIDSTFHFISYFIEHFIEHFSELHGTAVDISHVTYSVVQRSFVPASVKCRNLFQKQDLFDRKTFSTSI